MLEVKEVSKLYENQRGVNHIDFFDEPWRDCWISGT